MPPPPFDFSLCNFHRVLPRPQLGESQALTSGYHIKNRSQTPLSTPFSVPCMLFLSPLFIGLTDQDYALKLQGQQQFQASEATNVQVSGLISLSHVFPDSFDTLGNALLSLPEPQPSHNYLLRTSKTPFTALFQIYV